MDLPKFIEYAKILPQHAVMDKLVLCLYFDNSSTVCASAVTLLARLIPYIAACDATVMKHLLPQFLAILVRIMLWKERPDADEFADDTPSDPELDRELEKEANRTLRISPKITWERLETMFNRLSAMKQVPHSRSLFTILYYLFPSNVLRFLRNPVQYLVDKGLESPFVETWAEAFRPLDLVRRIAEVRWRRRTLPISAKNLYRICSANIVAIHCSSGGMRPLNWTIHLSGVPILCQE